MSDARRDLDLSGLARGGPPAPAPPPKKLVWILPTLVVIAVVAVLARPLTEAFLPRVAVTIARPLAQSGVTTTGGGHAVLAASGFVEADPTPVHVSALVEGVVRELLVQTGDAVLADAVVARLIDDDARIACAKAGADLATARADSAIAEAEERAATRAFEARLEWDEALRSAEADARQAAAAIDSAIATTRAADARVAAATAELELAQLLEASGSAGLLEVKTAQARLDEALAQKDGAAAGVDAANAAAGSANARLARVTKGEALRIEDHARVERATAGVMRAAAAVAAAEAAVAAAELARARTEVRSPTAGVVYVQLAAPGDRVGGDASALFTVFDPDRLRVRVDVPQQEAFRVAVGMQARITLDGTDLDLAGRVVRHVPRADLTKTAIPIHVVLEHSDARLRPDLLVRVQFFALPNASAAGAPSSSVVTIPRRLVGADGTVFVVDEHDRAQRRSVTLGAEVADERVQVVSGLTVADRVVDAADAALESGTRVRVRAGGP